MFGECLKRARFAAGLSMKELSLQAGVSANMIKKYEHNESMPSSGVLVKMSRALGVRNEYFFRPAKFELKGLEYRKRSTAPEKVLNRIKADVLDQAERWMELCNLWPNFPLPAFSKPNFSISLVNDYHQVEIIANELRELWDLGSQPITKAGAAVIAAAPINEAVHLIHQHKLDGYYQPAVRYAVEALLNDRHILLESDCAKVPPLI